MTQSTSSAEYLKLYHYSDAALQLDSNLVVEANRLRGALLHFEATCREPAFRQSVSHVADGMVMYGARAAVVDAWVRVVGLGFQAADGGGLAALLPPWLPPWMVGPWPISWWPGDRRRVELLPVEPLPITLPPWLDRIYLWPGEIGRQIPQLITLPPAILPPWLDRIFLWPGETGRQAPQPLDPVVVKPPTEDGNTGDKEGGGSNDDGETELGKILRPPTKEALRQDQVEKGDPLLDAIRYYHDDQGGLHSQTVEKQINNYGCLMTSFAMLLRDQGQSTKVTDIYRANYKRWTKRSIDEDLAQDDDQNPTTKDITLEHLYLDPNAIKDVTHEKYGAADGDNLLTGPIDESIKPSGNLITDRLHSNLNKFKGDRSIIIHVKTQYSDGHWVVVDSYDEATNTFTLRDPMKGLVTGVRIPSSEYNPEDTKGEVYYLKSL